MGLDYEVHILFKISFPPDFNRQVAYLCKSLFLKRWLTTCTNHYETWGLKGGRPMAKERKCGHPACNCTALNGDKYCSPYCHDAGKLTELACNCGHEGCAEEMAHEG